MKKCIILFVLMLLGMFFLAAAPALAEDPVYQRRIMSFVDIGDNNHFIDHLSMSMNGMHLCASDGLIKAFTTEADFNTYMEVRPDSGLTWEQAQRCYSINCLTPEMTARDFFNAEFKVELVDYQGHLASMTDGSVVHLPLPHPPVFTIFFAE